MKNIDGLSRRQALSRACCFGIAVLLGGSAWAQTEALAAIFPLRATINTTGVGWCRLEIPMDVIGRCRADLADVRIIAHDGREIPYIVDSPESADVVTRVEYRASPEVVAVQRSREALGDRVTAYRESFVLGLPALPADVPAWDLVLSTARVEFVGRVDVIAVGPRGERIPVITAGSVFRLPSAGAEKLRLTIPIRNVTRLEIAIESQDQGYLRPRFAVESSRRLPEVGASKVGLEIREMRTLGKATEVVIDRPRGVVPRRLAISTSTGTFHRRVTVWDEGPGADPEPLAVSSVVRIGAVAPVEVLEIPMRTPRGDRLRVVFENQDSPALENVGFSAVMPRPALVFSLPEGPQSATLFFGGGRARRPRYDLAALDPRLRLPAGGEAVQQVLALLDPALTHEASLGEVEANPDYDPSPALAFAIHPGASIDGRLFSHRRRLEVAPSAEGLSRLRLEPADLAVLRDDLADLRIVDDEGRQWAYLRQAGGRPVSFPLEIAGHRRENRTSYFELEMPQGALVLDRIDIAADAPYFDRDFTLHGRLEDGSIRELARGRLVRREGDPRPTAISLKPWRVVGLELEIEDGDDAALALGRVEAFSATSDVYLAAGAGEYELLLGNPDAEPPVYELERIRSTILAVPASDVVSGELESNPAFSPALRLSGVGLAQKLLLWFVLGLAVIVLVVLTLRAANQEAG
ncbi:MAG: hypothetical protein ACC742_02855 [Thermoanaerobaculales bacterium]